MTLDFDGSVLETHRSVRDVVAQGVYRRGLKRIAAELDASPGNLSTALADGDDSSRGHRKFSVDELERYIQVTGDKSPIYFLVAKYLGDEAAARDQALANVQQMLEQLPAMLAHAGLNGSARGRR